MEPFACVDGNGGRYPLSGPTRRVEKTAAAQGQRSFSPRIGGDFFLEPICGNGLGICYAVGQ